MPAGFKGNQRRKTGQETEETLPAIFSPKKAATVDERLPKWFSVKIFKTGAPGNLAEKHLKQQKSRQTNKTKF
jgi:hypothetical protein